MSETRKSSDCVQRIPAASVPAEVAREVGGVSPLRPTWSSVNLHTATSISRTATSEGGSSGSATASAVASLNYSSATDRATEARQNDEGAAAYSRLQESKLKEVSGMLSSLDERPAIQHLQESLRVAQGSSKSTTATSTNTSRRRTG